MTCTSHAWNAEPLMPLPYDAEEWYAVHTYPRHEKRVTKRIERHGVTTFLPMIRETHHWSDRHKTVELPLFSCYLFVRLKATDEKRIRVLQTDGVISLVGSQRTGTPIPDEEIEAVRTLLEREPPCSAYPFLKVGQRVRVRGGALDGLEGVFVSQNGYDSLVISVDAIQRSIAVRINGYDLDVL